MVYPSYDAPSLLVWVVWVVCLLTVLSLYHARASVDLVGPLRGSFVDYLLALDLSCVRAEVPLGKVLVSSDMLSCPRFGSSRRACYSLSSALSTTNNHTLTRSCGAARWKGVTSMWSSCGGGL